MQKEILDCSEIDWKVPIERSLLISPDIDHSSMRLYLILLSYARDKVVAFPSRETLAKDMNCSTRHIDTLKKRLKKAGLLDWEYKHNGQNKYNYYKLLKYKPIKPNYKTQKEEDISQDEQLVETAINFKKVYKNICKKNIDISDMLSSGWIHDSNYILTNGDKRNLIWYKKTYGAKGIEEFNKISKYLPKYLREEIEWGKFYNTDGSELQPNLSLFIKSKIQRDNLRRLAYDEMEREKIEENSKLLSCGGG